MTGPGKRTTAKARTEPSCAVLEAGALPLGQHVRRLRPTEVAPKDSLILYLQDDGFRPWPNLPTGPR